MKHLKKNWIRFVGILLLFCLGTVGYSVIEASAEVKDGGTFYEDVPEAFDTLLGASNYFHIFANKAHLANHTNGNVATRELSGSANFGTQGISGVEYNYAQKVLGINGASGIKDHTKMVFGNSVLIDLSEYHRPRVNGKQMDRVTGDEIFQDKGSQVYIDFDQEFAKLAQVSQELINQKVSKTYYNSDFKNENERVVDVSEFEGNDVYIRLTSEVLKKNTPLTIKGLEKNLGDNQFKNVYLIVEVDSSSSYTVQSQIIFEYTDGSKRGNKETTDFSDSTVLWTFSHENKPFKGDIRLNSTWLGSLLAPLASVGGGQNIDGNIIVDEFKGAGETHGWHFQKNKGGVVLRKLSASSGDVLAGAVFDLYQVGKSEPLKTGLVTNEIGELKLTDLLQGKYFFKEVKAPEGYELSNQEYFFTITQGKLNEVALLEVENEEEEPVEGSLKIIKSDGGDESKKLADAEFTLFNEIGEVVAEKLRTDEKGEVLKNHLPLGKYYLVETKAPEGYELSDEKYLFEIQDNQTQEVKIVKISNEKSPLRDVGAVMLNKVDEDNRSVSLKGAVFSLYNAAGKELKKNLTTDSLGELKVSDLALGNYYFMETKAPVGYQLSTEKYRFEIKAGDIAKVKRMTVTNEVEPRQELGSVILSKLDSEDSQTVLKGAVFSLYTEAGVEIYAGLVTDELGQLKAGNLPLGNYYFLETKAPEGYQLSQEKIPFEITRDNTQEALKVVAENEKEPLLGSALLEKIDNSDSSFKLSGATFSLYTETGIEVLDNLVTDDSGQIQVADLASGGYYFLETKAPEGYALNSKKYEFNITPEKMNEVILVQATNEKEINHGSVVLRKTDQIDGRALSGAEFSLFQASGELVISELISEKDGKIIVTNLPVGDYYFMESKAPVGYVLSEKVYPFTITERQTGELTTQVEVTNVAETVLGSVQLKKVDLYQPSKVLEGAEFSLYTASDELIASALTDETGILQFNQLPLGSYYLVEVAAPIGYQLSPEKYEFQITSENKDELVIITASNVKEPISDPGLGSAKLLKVDQDDETKVLKGAEFTLYHGSGEIIAENLTTNEEGILLVEDLVVGNYYFVETKAPFGYEVTSKKYSFDIQEGTISEVVELQVSNEKTPYLGSVELIKSDRDDETKVLENAEFALYDKNNQLIKESLLTNKMGRLTVENLVIGEYYFIETRAPQGYKKTSEKYYFEIQETEKAEMVTVTIRNEKLPEKPIEPGNPNEPSKPTSPSQPKTPVNSEKRLPRTGEITADMLVIGWTLVLGAVFIYWRKKQTSNELS